MDSLETVRVAFENLVQSQLPQALLVKRVRNLTQIIHVSPIVHLLANQTQLPVAIVAAHLVPILQQQLQQSQLFLGLPLSLEAQSTLKVQAIHSGLIEFEFSDQTIALWLKQLLASKPTPQFSKPYLEVQSEAVFAVQHSHARCCSLLRLAHSEKLILLQALESESIGWQFSQSLNGLSPDLLPLTPADRQLLSSLFGLWAALSQPIEQPTKLLVAASQSFRQFHPDVQLFDRGSGQTQWLLLMAIQRIIYLVLEKLQISTPTEL